MYRSSVFQLFENWPNVEMNDHSTKRLYSHYSSIYFKFFFSQSFGIDCSRYLTEGSYDEIFSILHNLVTIRSRTPRTNIFSLILIQVPSWLSPPPSLLLLIELASP